MLLKLYVKDFAIIEDLSVEFNSGMTTLTGQTGAGKSLLIDSISLLLGQRADTDMIRYKASKAIIEGVFTTNNTINDALESEGINVLDFITIKREIGEKKSSIKINDTIVNLQTLKKIGLKIGDIHAQHDIYRLINPDSYLDIIDKFGYQKINELKNNYASMMYKYNESLKKYKYAINEEKNANEKINKLKDVYDEIDKYHLMNNEIMELEDRIKKLSNYDMIFSNLKEAYELLDNDFFSIDNIYKAMTNLEKIEEFDSKFSQAKEMLSSFYYELDDLLLYMKKELKNMDFDPNELDESISRVNDLKNLEKKYQKSIDELIIYKEQIKFEIDLFTNYDNVIDDLKKKCIDDYNNLKKAKNILIDERKKIAKKLELDLLNECESLDLHDVKFEISFIENNFELFMDPTEPVSVDFLISLNYGEPVKSLHKSASGGELSRIMLGLKAILAKIENLGMIVFDEIDTGISGQTAYKIAKKIKDISKNTQILCITHLPHVAAMADNQLKIYKLLENDRTKTYIKYLNMDERINEIAIMLSGDVVSQSALKSASELLKA